MPAELALLQLSRPDFGKALLNFLKMHTHRVAWQNWDVFRISISGLTLILKQRRDISITPLPKSSHDTRERIAITHHTGHGRGTAVFFLSSLSYTRDKDDKTTTQCSRHYSDDSERNVSVDAHCSGQRLPALIILKLKYNGPAAIKYFHRSFPTFMCKRVVKDANSNLFTGLSSVC